MKALRRFTVRAHLPDRLVALERLSINLRWSWDKPTQDLFAAIDPELWKQVGCDPVALLGQVSPKRLDELAVDESFVQRLDALVADLDDYLSRPLWYQEKQAKTAAALPTGIAYFSMEFGVAEVLPNYSGGLGILAGDHLKSASDLGLPLIAVGLYYRSGYFRQSLTADGWQQENYPSLDPQGLPLRLLTDEAGDPVLVELAMPDSSQLRARVWIAQVGRVPLLLLDSDIPENEHDLRGVTDRLYGGDQEHRIKQEILAGIGGVRAIRAFTEVEGPARAPGVPHERGPCGLPGRRAHPGADDRRARFRHRADGGAVQHGVHHAHAGTRGHRPVPGGDGEAVLRQSGGQPVRCQLAAAAGGSAGPHHRVRRRGRPVEVQHGAHGPAAGAARQRGVAAARPSEPRDVQRAVAGFDPNEVPIGSITNGCTRRPGRRRSGWSWGRELLGSDSPSEPAVWQRLQQVDPGHLWWIRSQLREQLVEDVRGRLRRSWLERGASDAELGWIATAFDPDVLTIGFARRVPTYKRLTLMLRDPDRLEKLLLDEKRPIQLIVAGKSHPADDGGKALIQQVVRFADRPEVRHRIAFLPDYDMSMARLLYWGCDVWLNNPLRPLEACGTSGMKSALNGGLNLSIRDGWWDEWYDGENGWEIPTADGLADETRRDDLEAAALYDLLERSVAPKFYDRDERGIPPRWVEMVRHTLQTLGPKVLASRMVRDYTEKYYAPAAQSLHKTVESVDGVPFGAARELAAYRQRAQEAWPKIQITDVDSYGLPGHPAARLRAHPDRDRAAGGSAPDEVVVQAVVGRVDASDALLDPVTVPMPHTGTADGGNEIFSTTTPLPVAGPVGYTVQGGCQPIIRC